MLRALTYIDTQNKDNSHAIGQELIRPLSIAFGRSFKLDNEITEKTSSTVKKLAVIAIAVLVLPITLVLSGIGALLLANSSTHKQAYSQVKSFLNDSSLRNGVNSPSQSTTTAKPVITQATDSTNDYEFEFLEKIANRLISDVIYQALFPSAVYYDLYEDIEGSNRSDLPTFPRLPKTDEEKAIYKEKVPAIVEKARRVVESKLNKPVAIKDLLNEIAARNHQLASRSTCKIM